MTILIYSQIKTSFLQQQISATSGSTGEPFYFPRNQQHDLQHIYTLELILKNQFEIDQKSSLVIICFGLGIWIGGIINYKTFDFLSKKYEITILPCRDK